MFKLIDDILNEHSETGDQALDQQVNDIRNKHKSNPASANAEIERVKRDRMSQVSARIRALMQRKQQMNDQIDKQIEAERQRENVTSSSSI